MYWWIFLMHFTLKIINIFMGRNYLWPDNWCQIDCGQNCLSTVLPVSLYQLSDLSCSMKSGIYIVASDNVMSIFSLIVESSTEDAKQKIAERAKSLVTQPSLKWFVKSLFIHWLWRYFLIVILSSCDYLVEILLSILVSRLFGSEISTRLQL